MNKIDKRCRIPYYYQLAEILRVQIQAGTEVNKSEILPSEEELIKTHKISKVTVRQAFNLLEREGLIHQGKHQET